MISVRFGTGISVPLSVFCLSSVSAGCCTGFSIHVEVTPVTRKRKRDLSAVMLKLDRADEHIEAFRLDLEAFLKQDPPPFGFRADPHTRPDKSIECVLYAIVRQQPPRKLALPVGDAIQNMRTALEYLAYELSSPRARKSGQTAFPIYSDETKFKLKGIPRIASIKGYERAFIERVQPYAATKIPSNDPLAILRKLSNLDKHQLLVPMIATVSARDSWVASDNADIDFTFIARGPVEHDTKIVVFTASPQDGSKEMKVDTQSGLEVEISDTGIVGFDISALELLQMIEHHIRWHIEWCFERGVLPRTWKELEQLS